jgi:hypothetical protein
MLILDSLNDCKVQPMPGSQIPPIDHLRYLLFNIFLFLFQILNPQSSISPSSLASCVLKSCVFSPSFDFQTFRRSSLFSSSAH